MKRMILLSIILLFIPIILYGQDKVEAPVWNTGDKWVLTDGFVEVVDVNETGYVVNFPKTKQIFNKSTLNIMYVLEGDKPKEYKGPRKRLLDFPLTAGKTWEDSFKSRARRSTVASQEHLYLEKFTALGWEDVSVKGGKFRAMKVEYYQKVMDTPDEGKRWYWYSPDVKYFVKCEHEKKPIWIGFNDWELASLRLKK